MHLRELILSEEGLTELKHPIIRAIEYNKGGVTISIESPINPPIRLNISNVDLYQLLRTIRSGALEKIIVKYLEILENKEVPNE